MSEAICLLCGASVRDADQQEHLESRHRGPHYFRFNGVERKAPLPSMTAFYLKLHLQVDASYSLHEMRAGETIFYEPDQAIDLTRNPDLWAVPPARM